MTTPSNLVTGDLCDAHKSHVDGRLRVLPPVFRDFGGRARYRPVKRMLSNLWERLSQP